MKSTKKISAEIKSLSRKLGFDSIGFSKARKLNEEESHFHEWLNSGHQGNMTYLENHFDKKLDPRKLVPGAKSIISLMYNYYPKEQISDDLKISKYAYGKDYHKVIKKRLKELMDYLDSSFEDLEYRVFSDSAPVMERQWARESGLGWIGKNTLLINPQKGSFFFLAEIILNQELIYDEPIMDHCGTCTKCLDACPTKAFDSPYVLNASKCISYLTIELKDEEIPQQFKGGFDNWIFGCDICQDVCPWNRFSTPHKENYFEASDDLKKMNLLDWNEMHEEKFDKLFEGSAVKRTKFKGLKRNIKFVQGD